MSGEYKMGKLFFPQVIQLQCWPLIGSSWCACNESFLKDERRGGWIGQLRVAWCNKARLTKEICIRRFVIVPRKGWCCCGWWRCRWRRIGSACARLETEYEVMQVVVPFDWRTAATATASTTNTIFHRTSKYSTFVRRRTVHLIAFWRKISICRRRWWWGGRGGWNLSMGQVMSVNASAVQSG